MIYRRAMLAALCLPALACAQPLAEVQGEYAGDGYAAQVIALSGGNFHIVGWRRGLPGVVPDAERIADGDGVRSGENILFKGNIWTAKIDAEGALTGGDDQGHRWTLHQVVRESPTLGVKPPPGATVLSDVNELKRHPGSFTLHLEALIPAGSSASVLRISGACELAIVDSFGQEPDDKSCGALLNLEAPAVNACLPPGRWQTFDIEFTHALTDGAGLPAKPAVITVKQNGIVIHDRCEIKVADPANEKESESPQSTRAGGGLVFRNIWILEGL